MRGVLLSNNTVIIRNNEEEITTQSVSEILPEVLGGQTARDCNDTHSSVVESRLISVSTLQFTYIGGGALGEMANGIHQPPSSGWR